MRIVVTFAYCALLAGCDAAPAGPAAMVKLSAATETVEAAGPDLVGDYLCTVAEKASIEGNHTEYSPPPKAVIEDRLPTRFRIRIANEERQGLRVIELPYQGADRDGTEWHTENSVIHSPYSWNGTSFSSTEKGSEAFFVLGPTVHSSDDGNLAFHHSGFEWAGGEDNFLSIRWGRCRKT